MSTAVVRPLFSAVDTLYVFDTAPTRGEVEGYLATAKIAAGFAAKARRDLPHLELAGIRFEVQARGTPTAPFLLKSPLMDVVVSPSPPRGLPTIVMELRSLLLCQQGAHAAHKLACRVRDELMDPQPLLGPTGELTVGREPLGITRVDLCLDVQSDSWAPPTVPSAYTTRAVHFTPYYVHGEFTGIRIGNGPVQLLTDPLIPTVMGWGEL